MTSTHSKTILILASVYNVGGGLTIIFLLDVLPPFAGFEPRGNILLRLFSGGVIIAFGLAYFHLALSRIHRGPILYLGTFVKCWAFVVALFCYLFYGLSLSMLFLFGVINLCFALLFTLILFATRIDVVDVRPAVPAGAVAEGSSADTRRRS